MKRIRDSRGRFARKHTNSKQYREASRVEKILVLGALLITITIIVTEEVKELVKPVEAFEEIIIPTKQEPKEVRIQVVYDQESIIEEIERVFGEGHIMLKVAWCESRYDQFAFNPTNGSNDRGVFQISEFWHGVGDEMYDVPTNVAFAKKLYDRNGLSDWSASRHCWSR